MFMDVLKLRDRGLSVFPVSVETKKPIVAWDRLQEELPTYEEVAKWFSAPGRAVGIATGPVSGVLLLDFDFAKHPEAYEFFNNHSFPRTWREKTQSGGIHIYFKWCVELEGKQCNTTSKLWPGVDTKGYGGYSKICPSPGYEWIIAPHMAPLASAPQWLIDLLPNKESRVIGDLSKPENWMVAELEAVQKGSGVEGRTPTFVRAIGRLKAKGLSIIEVKSLLAPWAQKYEYPKLDSLVDDQFNRYPPRPQTVSTSDEDDSFVTFSVSDAPVQWIAPKIIPANAIGFVAGLPEALKTWILIDLAIEFARGNGNWLNKFPVNQCKVLFLDQERGKDETRRRFNSMMRAKGTSAQALTDSLVVKSGTTYRLNLPQSCESFERLLVKHEPTVVIVDSFKTFHTKNELASHDMQEVLSKLKEFRTKFNCAFLFVHHETKGVHQRRKEGAEVTYLDAAGTIDLPQTAEVFFNVVSRGDGESMLYHTKNTQGKKFPPTLVKISDVVPDGSEIKLEAY